MELWLPWIEVAVAWCLALALAIVPFFLPIRTMWIRSILQILGILLALPVAFLTLWVTSSVWFGGHTSLLASPEGDYVTRVISRVGGATDLDHAEVVVRRRCSPVWTNAYFGVGQVNEQGSDPRVKWLDNRTLLIEYTGAKDYSAKCNNKVEKITVLCRRTK